MDHFSSATAYTLPNTIIYLKAIYKVFEYQAETDLLS